MLVSLGACAAPAQTPAAAPEAPAAAPEAPAAAPAEAPAAVEPEITIKFGSVNNDATPDSEYLRKVAEDIKTRSNGRIVMDIYYNSALGDNIALLEAMQLGTVEMGMSSVAFLGGFTDSTSIFDLPYLFKTREAAFEVCQTEVGLDILDSFSEIGLKGICWANVGYRNLTSNVEIRTPEQMNGRKIRTMDNEMHMACWEAMGASPIPMAFTELYTALQNGTIDDEENSWASFMSAKLYEVQKYVILTGHILDVAPIVASQTWWNSLSAEDQALISECFIGQLEFQLATDIAYAEEQRAYIESLGNIVVDLTDAEWEAFRAAVAPVYEKYGDLVGRDRIAAVDAINAKY